MNARQSLLTDLQTAQAAGDVAGEAKALQALALVELSAAGTQQEDMGTAVRERLKRAAEMLEGLGDLSGQATALFHLGRLEARAGRLEVARELLYRSTQLRLSLGDRAGLAAGWHELGALDLLTGKPDEAREKLHTALRLRQHLSDDVGVAGTSLQLGDTAMVLAAYGDAWTHYGCALRMRRGLDDHAGEAVVFHALSLAARELQRPSAAVRLQALVYLLYKVAASPSLSEAGEELNHLAVEAGLSRKELDEKLHEAMADYRRDRGESLAKGVFVATTEGGR